VGKKAGISPAPPPTQQVWTAPSPTAPRSPTRPAIDQAATEREVDLAALARRVAAGDPAAFHALVEATHRPIYRLALRTAGSASEAEDLVQETFARAWSALGRGARPQAIRPWLLGVARHVAADWLRAHRRRREAATGAPGTPDDAERLAALLADPRPGPRELVESAELSAAVRRAVDALPERHRVILLLREIDGLSYDELAAALGCPLGTVESRLYRARAALARRLGALAGRPRG
jgi:RNA polymerase sigma-70 factor, ECF subfamily